MDSAKHVFSLFLQWLPSRPTAKLLFSAESRPKTKKPRADQLTGADGGLTVHATEICTQEMDRLAVHEGNRLPPG